MPCIDPRLPPEESQSGITELASGERYIAASRRPDGSTRKEIKVRPGYRPPEDVERYQNRTAAAWKNRGKGEVPGAAFEGTTTPITSKPKPSNKPSRRPAAKPASGIDSPRAAGTASEPSPVQKPSKEETPVDPEAEIEKTARKLSKKLRQARELQQKKEEGGLLPEQFQKVIQMNELIRQLDSLGFDQEGERKGP